MNATRTAAATGRTRASPLARRIARTQGLDLSRLTGSGPGGRIVEKDVRAAMVRLPVSEAAEPVAGMPASAVREAYRSAEHEVVPVDGMRRAIARRLVLSKQTIPHFYLSLDCRLDALGDVRDYINAAAPLREDGTPEFRLTVNDFLVRALALALQRVPEANAVWTGEEILRFRHSDVAVAVAVPGGLVTPVIRQAETLPLAGISARMRDFAARGRARKLATEEMAGGVTAVSNLGMHGIREFQAVINPPQSTILAVGAGAERVVVQGGQPAVARMMTVTLSADHRVVDGVVAAELLAAFRRLIETPMTLVV